MKQLPFDIEPDSANSPAVGLVVLQSDETMEHELRMWLPDTVRLFHTRIPNAVEISADSLHQMKAALPAATSLLPSTTSFKVIVYGCTSGSTIIGEAAVADAINKIFPDAKVTNPLSAIKAHLIAMGIKNLAVLTPYVPEVSKALLDEIESIGVSIVRSATFNESRDNQVARISGDAINSAIDELGTHNDVDAVFASCTNLRMAHLIDSASERVGLPVISSNSALAWHIQQLLAA